MNIFLLFIFFFDIAPPVPVKLGWAGIAFAVAFGLVLSATATASFLILKNKLSFRNRTIIAGILLLIGFGGAILLGTLTLLFDYDAERNRQPYVRPLNPDEERYQYEDRKDERPGNANTNQKTPTNSNK